MAVPIDWCEIGDQSSGYLIEMTLNPLTRYCCPARKANPRGVVGAAEGEETKSGVVDDGTRTWGCGIGTAGSVE